MKKKIYLSAPGLVCCAGHNRNELYESCLNGYQGGLVMYELPDRSGKTPVGFIGDELPTAILPDSGCPRDALCHNDPLAYTGGTKIIRILNAALEQLRPTIEKALSKYSPERIGICFGSGDNGSEASHLAHLAFFKNNAFPEDFSLRFQNAFSVEFISRKFDISGPAFTVATACASGASAIMRGADLIQAGYCDAVIAGGAEIVSEMVFYGFSALEAISNSLTNPFSKNRKGINLGEGAAFFLLDSEQNSGVELLGAGESSDAHHMTAPGPDGAGPARAMKAALADAGINSDEIDYVNLHGTGTELNDKAEAFAMNTVFNSPPPANSTKPITGHTLGAAGALEAAICWMVLTEQRGIPVHCWDGVRDEEVPFIPSSGSGHETPSTCMSNSFAFGGCNVSLILGRVHND
jgi:3-oxoacyl-[acyl-carrier-protein] synthase-1